MTLFVAAEAISLASLFLSPGLSFSVFPCIMGSPYVCAKLMKLDRVNFLASIKGVVAENKPKSPEFMRI